MMDFNEEVYIILVNYNGAKDTVECVKSIKENEKKCKCEIVVVDNKSTDNSIEILEKIQNIHLIKSEINGGFAMANNVGIRFSLEHGAENILLLNNDTEITSNAISKMLTVLKKENYKAIIGARIMYFDNKELINYCGGEFDWLKGNTVHNQYMQEYRNDKPETFETDFITGCCMMINKEVFNEVGFLPEDYFMYFEDADYCMMLKEANYKLIVCTDSVIYHKVSSSSGGEYSEFAIKWLTRNRLVFLNKYKKYTKGFITLSFVYIGRFIRYIQYYVKGEKNKSKAIINGMREGRKIIKEKRK